MGKVSRRLTIVVFPPLDDWPEIAKLEEQGHRIIRVDDSPSLQKQVEEEAKVTALAEGTSLVVEVFSSLMRTADLIIGPQCWYFDAKHRKYLTSAIKQARLRRYGAPQRKGNKTDAEDADIPFGDGPDTGKP